MIVLYVGVQLSKSLKLMVCADCNYYMIWSREEGVPWCQRYQQMLVIRTSSVGMKQGVFISCLLIFFSEQNGGTVFHCPTTVCPRNVSLSVQYGCKCCSDIDT
jgi:hypothetical protein